MPIDMAEYMRQRREDRRNILRIMIGGACIKCGSKRELEFDHIDPATKSFTIASGLDGDWDILVAEAKKCELRCRPCHLERSRALGHLGSPGERNGMWVEAIHGTAKMYDVEKCKCDQCRQWKRDYRAKRVDSRGRPLSSVV